MTKENEDTYFLDAESQGYGYTQKGMLSFQQILLIHLRKICDLSTQEFSGGYWNTQLIQLGGGLTTTNKTYVPDARAEYIQAVDTLYDLAYPYFDEDMKKADSKLKAGKTKDKDELVILRRELFRELGSLLKRLNFLRDEA